MTTIREFGKELQRGFEVHENCDDCAEFYCGCEGWRASRDFGCRCYNRLPDVMPGTCGQRFPPPRRQAPVSPVPEPIEHQPAERSRQTAPESDTAMPPLIEVPPKNPPANPKARICGCGTPLSKGKQLCDACRTQNRRATMRDYMRTRRAGSGESRPDSGIRAKRAETLSAQRCGDERRLTRPVGRVPLCFADNCITNAF